MRSSLVSLVLISCAASVPLTFTERTARQDVNSLPDSRTLAEQAADDLLAQDDDGKSAIRTRKLVGIILGCVLATLVVMSTVYLIMRRRRAREEHNYEYHIPGTFKQIELLPPPLAYFEKSRAAWNDSSVIRQTSPLLPTDAKKASPPPRKPYNAKRVPVPRLSQIPEPSPKTAGVSLWLRASFHHPSSICVSNAIIIDPADMPSAREMPASPAEIDHLIGQVVTAKDAEWTDGKGDEDGSVIWAYTPLSERPSVVANAKFPTKPSPARRSLS
ncbi:hypothetical protein FISHEDRAFT_78644 [Fistulina hepatica ATCC 64428]|uniref:Uncharacterized protein n=1 Tax=Fistulina hepatica ATCC 64428 TaxID=1128425 RepID=A0A0D7A0J0_9AGAR|nr:hypothetical protein FISHEDRAFT_78644 [Fistulina hepatica ATCC 64428]